MVALVENEEQKDADWGICTSDSESAVYEPSDAKPHGVYSDGMACLNEEDNEFILLKHRFYTSIGLLAQNCKVVAASKNMHSTPIGRARMEAFRCYLKATAERRNGNPNVTNGWYGCTENEIYQIIRNGFGTCQMPDDDNLLGLGLNLFSESSAIDSVLSAPVDRDGLRHIVFCRVILGNTEAVTPGSRQLSPSSEKFDSGIDKLQSPKKFVIWYPNVNTHVLPLYVLSVKLDIRPQGLPKEHVRRPTSPWVPFDILISVLEKYLPHSTMCMIRRYHSQYMERKITRQQLIRHLRELSGDKLLIRVIKSFRGKIPKATVAS